MARTYFTDRACRVGCSRRCRPDLLENVGIFDLVIPSQQQHLAGDLGGLGIIVREGQKDPAPVLAVDRHNEQRPAGQHVGRAASQVNAVLGHRAFDQDVGRLDRHIL